MSDRPMRILVFPGIGDIHWVVLKLRAFMKQKNAEAEVHIWDFDGRPRSADYVQRVPFVRFGGYFRAPIEPDKKVFDQVYMTGELSVKERFRDFDYLLCPNGLLRAGRELEAEFLPGLPCEWDYPVTETPEDARQSRLLTADHNKYILLFFSNYGMFSQWASILNETRMNTLVAKISAAFPDHIMFLTGSHWDAEQASRVKHPKVFNLVGKTPLGPFLSMIRKASAFVGFCGGNTILSVHLRTPTVIFWTEYFINKRFFTNWVDPKARRTIYRPISLESLDYDIAIEETRAAMVTKL